LDLAGAFLAVASGCANFGTRGGVKFDLHRFSSARALPITFSSGIEPMLPKLLDEKVLEVR
jgi:hypothetical protein